MMTPVRTLLLLLALIAPLMVAAAPAAPVASSSGIVPGRALPYRVWLPKGYADRTDWPLIIFLHGSGERGWDMEELAKWGLPKWLEAGNTLPAVVLAPQCPPTRAWETEDIDAVIDEALKNYKVDEERVSLTGFSMGAIGSFDYAAKRGWRLSSVGPVAGSMPQRYFPRMAHTDTWIICGEKDTAVLASESREARDKMLARGMKPKFTELPGADHTSAARIAYEEMPEFYAWMLASRRSPLGLRDLEAENLHFEMKDKGVLKPGQPRELAYVARNTADQARTYSLAWVPGAADWQLSPPKLASKKLAPGETWRVPVSVSIHEGPAELSRGVPFPQLRTVINGQEASAVSTELGLGLDNSGLSLAAGAGVYGPASDAFYTDKAQPVTDTVTTVKAAWDLDFLTLRVRCEDSGPDAEGKLGNDGDLWTEDSVEFFIVPEAGGKEYAQFIVSRSGALYDAWVYDRAWSSSATAKALPAGEHGWDAELKIPLSLLTKDPEPGQRFGFEVARNDITAGTRRSLQWAPTLNGNHSPERFGVLELMPASAEAPEPPVLELPPPAVPGK